MLMAEAERQHRTLSEMWSAQGTNGGMFCPECGSRIFVANKWTLENGTVRRLHKCRGCGYSFHSDQKVRQ